jgi:hypothetical protein
MMKKIKLLSLPILLFAMVLFTTTPSFGALGKVAGVVTDAASGEALPASMCRSKEPHSVLPPICRASTRSLTFPLVLIMWSSPTGVCNKESNRCAFANRRNHHGQRSVESNRDRG